MEKKRVPTKSGYYDLHYTDNGQFAPKDGDGGSTSQSKKSDYNSNELDHSAVIVNPDDFNFNKSAPFVFKAGKLTDFDLGDILSEELPDDLKNFNLEDILSEELPDDLKNLSDFDLSKYYNDMQAKFTPTASAEGRFDSFFEDLQKCKKEHKKLILDALLLSKFRTVKQIRHKDKDGRFVPATGEILIDAKRGIKEGDYVKNGVIFHELGHAIDCMIGKRNIGGGYCSVNNYVSFSFKCSNGKTLYEALEEDAKKIDWVKLTIEVLKLKNNEIGPKVQAIDELKLKRDKMLEAFATLPPDSTELKEKKDELYKITSEIESLGNEKQAAEQKFKTAWADVSDMASAFNLNKLSSYPWQLGIPNIGFGHRTDYWTTGGKSTISTEFFAEMFQAATVNKKSYENMKHYFPTAVKNFEEIINEYFKE